MPREVVEALKKSGNWQEGAATEAAGPLTGPLKGAAPLQAAAPDGGR